MAREYVCEMEDRWPAARAGVENSKQRLEVAIQVHRGNHLAAKLQQIVAGVPPAMTNACGYDYGPPGWRDNFLRPDLSAECSRFHGNLLLFLEMHVQWRTVRPWRQGAIEDEDELSLSVARATHPEDLSCTAVFQRQTIHDLPSICIRCSLYPVIENNLYESPTSQTVLLLSWLVEFWTNSAL
jgi:hypothetical protein